MKGIYTNSNEASFVPDEEIKRRLYLSGEHRNPRFITELPPKKDFHAYSRHFIELQEERGETYVNRAEIQLFDTSLVNFQSDLHIGGEETDYKRIEREAEIIVNTPNSYVVLLGDIVDNFNFSPATHETLDVVPKQIKYARELIKYYSENNKLLAVWQGNHDYWSMKNGVPLYEYLLDGVNVPFFFGVGYLTIYVNEEAYRITGSHQFQGSSIYNKAHPQNRAIRFGGAWGSDLVVSGHLHEKAIAQQAFEGFGGVSQITTMMALGTYKLRDGYTRNKAFAPRDQRSAYGASVILDANTHTLVPSMDILEAHDLFIRHSS